MLVAVTICSQAKDRGDNDYREAKAAESRQDWDRALKAYMSALDKNPSSAACLIGMRRMRFQSSQRHVNLGQRLRADGRAVEALGEFQKALIADPGSSIAIQEIRRTQEILDEKPTADRARRESDERTASIQPPPDSETDSWRHSNTQNQQPASEGVIRNHRQDGGD
jgi:tetratricopeptide (TPR) repeat protein